MMPKKSKSSRAGAGAGAGTGTGFSGQPVLSPSQQLDYGTGTGLSTSGSLWRAPASSGNHAQLAPTYASTAPAGFVDIESGAEVRVASGGSTASANAALGDGSFDYQQLPAATMLSGAQHTMRNRCWPIESRGLNVFLLSALVLGGAVVGGSFAFDLSNRLASEIMSHHISWSALVATSGLATLIQGLSAINAEGHSSRSNLITAFAAIAQTDISTRCGQRMRRAEPDQKMTAIAWAIAITSQALLWSGIFPNSGVSHDQAKWAGIFLLGAIALMASSTAAWVANRYFPKRENNMTLPVYTGVVPQNHNPTGSGESDRGGSGISGDGPKFPMKSFATLNPALASDALKIGDSDKKAVGPVPGAGEVLTTRSQRVDLASQPKGRATMPRVPKPTVESTAFNSAHAAAGAVVDSLPCV